MIESLTLMISMRKPIFIAGDTRKVTCDPHSTDQELVDVMVSKISVTNVSLTKSFMF